MKTATSKQSKAGHHSPELMLPIAVIAIMAGAMLPALAKMKERGTPWYVAIPIALLISLVTIAIPVLYVWIVESSASKLKLDLDNCFKEWKWEKGNMVGWLDFSDRMKRVRLATKTMIVISSCIIGYVLTVNYYPPDMTPGWAMFIYSAFGLLLNSLLIRVVAAAMPGVRRAFTTRTAFIPRTPEAQVQ